MTGTQRDVVRGQWKQRCMRGEDGRSIPGMDRAGGTGKGAGRTEDRRGRMEDGRGRMEDRRGRMAGGSGRNPGYRHAVQKRRRRRSGRFFRWTAAAALFIVLIGPGKNIIGQLAETGVNIIGQLTGTGKDMVGQLPGVEAGVQEGDRNAAALSAGAFAGASGNIEEELSELLEKNEETLDYVQGYPDREKYKSQPVDLSGDVVSGEVPLLMQWDRRWGYDLYGKELIGFTGCGPLCLDMAYLYFTGDLDMDPRKMAEYAYDGGYYTEQGTSWALWTEGAAGLGLAGEELPLDEDRMKQALDEGGLVVCSMRPGDFTTTGHFILIRGYCGEGFYVNDPNRRSTSEKVWDFRTLQYQIKNLWGLRLTSTTGRRQAAVPAWPA